MHLKKYKIKQKIYKKKAIRSTKILRSLVAFTSKMLKTKRRLKFFGRKFEKSLSVRLAPRLVKLNKEQEDFLLKRNVLIRTYFVKILRRSIRKKSILKRSTKSKPIFTRRRKKERKFYIKIRKSLIETKRFLYRKQFPKINGKKNRKFNFNYYNNLYDSTIRFYIGRLVITYLNNNTFINIHSSKKMLKVYSAGMLGFRGPKRSTPYSRQVVARKAVKFLLKTNINVLDIYLNSNYNRWYYFLFKEFSKPKIKPYSIRYLIANNPRSHGFLRDKKHRRK